jgi:hypothetical protein
LQHKTGKNNSEPAGSASLSLSGTGRNREKKPENPAFSPL